MKCGVANEQNLRPGEYQLSKEEAKKGGIKSGESRRKKADLRKAFRTAMETTYTDKNGTELTGEEIVIRALMQNLSDPKGRNFGKSLDAAISLLGAKESDVDVKIKKAQLEILKAQAENAKKNGANDENVTVVIDV